MLLLAFAVQKMDRSVSTSLDSTELYGLGAIGQSKHHHKQVPLMRNSRKKSHVVNT